MSDYGWHYLGRAPLDKMHSPITITSSQTPIWVITVTITITLLITTATGARIKIDQHEWVISNHYSWHHYGKAPLAKMHSPRLNLNSIVC